VTTVTTPFIACSFSPLDLSCRLLLIRDLIRDTFLLVRGIEALNKILITFLSHITWETILALNLELKVPLTNQIHRSM